MFFFSPYTINTTNRNENKVNIKNGDLVATKAVSVAALRPLLTSTVLQISSSPELKPPSHVELTTSPNPADNFKHIQSFGASASTVNH